jgi:2TM domain
MSLGGPESEDDLRRRAERRVRVRQGLITHAGMYVLVNAGLAGINLVTSPHYLWFLWSALGWGIGLAAHAWAAFSVLSGDHERAVQAEMARLRGRGR